MRANQAKRLGLFAAWAMLVGTVWLMQDDLRLFSGNDLQQAKPLKLVLPFSAVDKKGTTLDHTKFDGQWLLLHFSHSACGQACEPPQRLLNQLDARLDWTLRRKLQLLVITVNPLVDTPERLNDWEAALELKQRWWVSPTRVLTGSAAQINNLARSTGAASDDVCSADGSPREALAANGSLYVITPDRRLAALLPGAMGTTAATAYLSELMTSNGV